MSFFTKLLNTKFGSIAVSILIGLGTASIFRRVCQGDNCLVIEAPDPESVRGGIYELKSKSGGASSCVSFETKLVKCGNEVVV